MRIDSEPVDLARQLREMADQLHFLEKKRSSPATRPAGRQYLLDGQPIDMKILAEFKSSLDRTRHSVWALLEAFSGTPPWQLLKPCRNIACSEPVSCCTRCDFKWRLRFVPIRRRRGPSLKRSELVLRRHMREPR